MIILPETMVETNTYTVHSTWLKRIVNPILRKIQYRTNTPYVIASEFDSSKNTFIRYIIRRVSYDKNADPGKSTCIYLKTGKEIRITIKYYIRKLFK